MVEAKYYQQGEGKKVRCNLCPHFCKLDSGATGICMVRINKEGKLYSNSYGMLTAVNMDPIEKKPLFHYFPGHEILSIGGNGCNMKCKCCQNWEISQSSTTKYHNFKTIELDEIVELAKSRNRNIGVAYTYNEPIIWIEYLMSIAGKIKKAGMKNVLVSNGYINPEPLDELLEFIDAFNIDLKAFTEDKYREMTKTSLQPVKDSIKKIGASGRHIEITHLVIPGFNDSSEEFWELVDWIYNETGENTVLHLSRYFPSYKMDEPATSPSVLKEFYDLAREKLNYVYLGNINIESAQDTVCSKCKNKVISRKGYLTNIMDIDSEGKCCFCGNPIIINS